MVVFKFILIFGDYGTPKVRLHCKILHEFISYVVQKLQNLNKIGGDQVVNCDDKFYS
jgi:hypothetical protein